MSYEKWLEDLKFIIELIDDSQGFEIWANWEEHYKKGLSPVDAFKQEHVID